MSPHENVIFFMTAYILVELTVTGFLSVLPHNSYLIVPASAGTLTSTFL